MVVVCLYCAIGDIRLTKHVICRVKLDLDRQLYFSSLQNVQYMSIAIAIVECPDGNQDKKRD